MLRMCCLQQWYGLANEAPEDALHDTTRDDSRALRDFVGVDLSCIFRLIVDGVSG